MTATAHFSGIRTTIQQELAQATNSIRVAVAWFTDQSLFTTLLDKLEEEVSVIAVIRNDVLNLHPNGLRWQQFINAGGTLYFSHEHPALHHKFCLIDDQKLISGSYNWTYTAQHNHENIITTSQAEVVRSFRTAFDALLSQATEVATITLAATQTPPVTNPALESEALAEVEYRDQSKLLDTQHQDYEQLVLAGNAAYLQKRYAESETLLNQALMVRPKGIEAFYLLSGMYWRTGQFQKSIDASRKAEVLGIESAELWNNFGLAYDGLRRYKEAIGYFNQAIQLTPQHSGAYRNKALAQYRNRQIKDGEVTALEGGRVAAETIRKHKNSGDKLMLLQAYIDRAILHSDLPEARRYAQEGLAVFRDLPPEEQDMHELDDINDVLNEKLRF